MLLRYSTNASGKQKKVAKVYTKDEHGIDAGLIDPKAVMIVKKLQEAGFESYIVGGAVRDLLIGRIPKDFDIATEARPRQIKRLFWNSRIIGRRFKLVHIHFPDKIFEVSTFRALESPENGEGNNFYGTVEEDARRRDFSVNALYYSPVDQILVDYVDAMKDMKSGVIRSILPLESTFLEDPVRMVRGIKYAAMTGFSMKFSLKRAIRRHSSELARASSSRMTEEVFKLLQSGCSEEIVRQLVDMKLFVYVLPVISELIHSGKHISLSRRFYESLSELDRRIASEEDQVSREHMLTYLVRPFLLIPEEYESPMELFRELFSDMKRLIHPITPPNIEVEKAVALVLDQEAIKVPKHAVRKPKSQVTRYHGKRDDRSGRRRGGGKKKPKPQQKPKS